MPGLKGFNVSAECGGVRVVTNATFTVVRPTNITMAITTGNVSYGFDGTNADGSTPFALDFGVIGDPGITISNSFTMPVNGPTTYYNNGSTNYTTEWIQVVIGSVWIVTESNSVTGVRNYTNQTVGWCIDTACPYPFTDYDGRMAEDSPTLPLSFPNQIAATNFQVASMWLMFQPANGNWVPLWIVDWAGKGGAQGFGSNPSDWSLVGDNYITNTWSRDSGTRYPELGK